MKTEVEREIAERSLVGSALRSPNQTRIVRPSSTACFGKRVHPFAAPGESKAVVPGTSAVRSVHPDVTEEHQAGVWRYLRYVGCEPPEADDLTQDTFDE